MCSLASFKLKYITTEDPLYQKAVAIREELFFQNMENSSGLINDNFELNSFHLVCLNADKVVGTGRLHFKNDTGIISQMAIKTAYQKQGVGTRILEELISNCKERKLNTIRLSARETALTFYEKFNFKGFGEKYPSKKTKIIHQQMELKIK